MNGVDQKAAPVAGHLILIALLVGLTACGGGGGGNSAANPPATSSQPPVSSQPYVFDNPGMRSRAKPYIQSAPHKDVLTRCTVTLREGQECSLTTLPLLGMETSDPTVDEIMARVVVSHAWMGERFRQVLEVLPVEIRLLTRALTAIVISYDIRPSFHTTQTGAIYLDPAGLWITQEEEASISDEPDYRSEFGKVLNFIMLWRYTRDEQYVTFLPTDRDRTVDEIKYRMASLMFHELAHANDYFPREAMQSVNRNIPIWQAIAQQNRPSSNLAQQYPLRSSLMRGLAQVSFAGASATAIQTTYTAEDVAGEFPNDYANDYYNYTTNREDMAMLFEELMMLYSYAVDRDVAVTNYPDSEECADYIVAWGQRNRILEPATGQRALYVAGRLLPELLPTLEGFLASYDTGPTLMVNGKDWCANRFLEPGGSARSLEIRNRTETVETEYLVPYL